MVVTILGNTNTLPEKYRIAQYADPPYRRRRRADDDGGGSEASVQRHSRRAARSRRGLFMGIYSGLSLDALVTDRIRNATGKLNST